MIRLVVGLGNPGAKYENNRHNVGFMAVDAIVHRHRFAPFRSKFQGDLAEGDVGGCKVLVLKPRTYMNESGRAVGAAARFFKIPPQDVLVIYDELDLAAGKIRVKLGGGLAGHNGLRSIAAAIGPEYHRLRIGIGHPGDKALVTSHVLGDFSKADKAWRDPLLEAIAERFEMLLEGDGNRFMTFVARDTAPPKAKTQPTRDDGEASAGNNEKGSSRHGV
ncbi:aminoacyl-tRNA hydrolase [Varunaivibrio sulfuroxidans]|uniref:Peptidyl-tRNA hydrolase n=1 Tax=Varunaivibrio sulfuroxidans TaxID=1773489 RepID=A0A4R3J6F1_9PROT|nr:aminoacyl-tRNA hydrolase [Varunaivibrio sulfuroxidans]TCS60904.1 peptidyl-tRNA hydrolase [Varunaivibrio sulfuroxidans]WES31687.1 aminoacyl-tRNA hydrolase [Varunaivibrio sulfuroxidans]